jgi:hypothetical protein
MRPLPLPSARTRAIHLVTLSSFAVAQPELQHLARAPEYFVVRGYHAGDVVLFSLLLVLCLPLVLMAVEMLAGLIHPVFVTIVHQFFMCVLTFLIIVEVFARHRFGWMIPASVGLMVVFATAYRFWMPAQAFLTMAAFASILFVAVFLSQVHLGSLSVSAPPGVVMPVVKSKTPVVLVIFDEFALSSLLTRDGTIDGARYPNFASLARSSTWYRGATTNYDVTDRAVPAILTGRLRRHDQLPIVADHPRNLFTLLGQSYEVRAFQAEARLCPTNLCRDASLSFKQRVRRVLSDVEKTSTLRKPHWEGDWSTPASEVKHFLAAIGPRKRPQLAVLHTLLPHVPYQYLPSGRAYANKRALPGYGAGYRWAKNPWFVDHNYERYLLQLGYTDAVLGKIMARLRSTGLWDRSLVIVIADHGVSFHPGGHRRYVDLDNVGDIAPIPMFVKRPGQQRGKIDRLSATSIDVVPTIVQELGTKAPWKLDGTSLFARDRRPPTRIVVRSYTGRDVTTSWARVESGQRQTLAWKLRLFGSGEDSVFAEGTDRQLIGRRVDAFPRWRATTARAQINLPSTVSFDPQSSQAPSRVTGNVTDMRAERISKLAIAVDGRIVAVTNLVDSDGKHWFSTFVPDSVFRPGANRLTVLALRTEGDRRLALAKIGSKGSESRLSAAGP